MHPTQTTDPTSPALQRAVQRARAEFLEMPGLRLTAAQARRLWMLDASVCDVVLSELLAARFIRRTAGAAYVRNDG